MGVRTISGENGAAVDTLIGVYKHAYFMYMRVYIYIYMYLQPQYVQIFMIYIYCQRLVDIGVEDAAAFVFLRVGIDMCVNVYTYMSV